VVQRRKRIDNMVETLIHYACAQEHRPHTFSLAASRTVDKGAVDPVNWITKLSGRGV